MGETPGFYGIYWCDAKSPTPYERGHCLFIVEENTSGPVIHWLSAPEPVMVAVLKNLDEPVAKSITGQVWCGQQVLNMIFNCKIRHYDQIQIAK